MQEQGIVYICEFKNWIVRSCHVLFIGCGIWDWILGLNDRLD